MAISQQSTSGRPGGGNGSAPGESKHIDVILDLVRGVDPRTRNFMPNWDLETARQKLLFFTAPKDFAAVCEAILPVMDDAFATGSPNDRRRLAAFLVHIADSLNSKVELSHNLQNKDLHGDAVLSDEAVGSVRRDAESILSEWEKTDKDAVVAALSDIKAEDIAVNKGDNLFIAWAREWEKKNGRDPYGSIADFLSCFKGLYAPETYYVSLYFAWRAGKTQSQFFNDYGLHAARCR